MERMMDFIGRAYDWDATKVAEVCSKRGVNYVYGGAVRTVCASLANAVPHSPWAHAMADLLASR